MRPPRKFLFGVPVLAAVIAAGIAGFGFSARAASVSYVALGDSYSAGIGAGATAGPCGQSPNAYPALWARANPAAAFKFAACSGARTSDVISSQLSWLSSSTTLVSVTIGGNDAGFSSIMQTCVLKSAGSCQNAVSAGEEFVDKTLPARLDTLLADIRARAPSAQVVVLDYPDFYDLGAWLCLGLPGADHTALDTGIDDLDGVLEAAAVRAGDTFADVRGEFAGHELCDGAGWLNSVTLPVGNSYHPTATGQRGGYLPALTAAAGG